MMHESSTAPEYESGPDPELEQVDPEVKKYLAMLGARPVRWHCAEMVEWERLTSRGKKHTFLTPLELIADASLPQKIADILYDSGWVDGRDQLMQQIEALKSV